MTGTDLNMEPLECGYKRGKTPLIRNLGTRCRRIQRHSLAVLPPVSTEENAGGPQNRSGSLEE